MRRTGRLAGRVAAFLCCAVVAIAPLAVGGVHRGSMIVLLAACALALAALAAGLFGQRRPLRMTAGVILPLVMLAIPILQSISLPLGLRGLLDPHGNALLLENDLSPARSWPLSLDPAPTREHVGMAAAAVAVFLIAYHLASGKSKRHLLARVVGLTGVTAVAIGLGHRLFGFSAIYGTFVTPHRSLLTGPFVNANHTAELLELAAFACLACSLQRNTLLNRYGWLTAMLVCTVGALATTSRSSLIALATGLLLFGFLRHLARSEGAREPSRIWIAATVGLVALVVITAGALGAGALVDRFRGRGLGDEVRFALWRDSLSVLLAHPAGIGRGAFEHVYPVYRTLKTQQAITFGYVESYPLQLLLDSGWIFFGAIAAGVLVVGRLIVRTGRHDKIEAAFLGGLAAVGAHSVFDFGLETLGVLLPFTAILGTVLGRGAPTSDAPAWRRVAPVIGVTCAALVFGALSVAHASDDDFDRLLKRAHGVAERREVLLRAQRVHPTDYYYALAFAGTEPLKPGPDGRSPRLHALNRALRLCPRCQNVHVAVGRSLWQLGLRKQGLVEWRTALDLQPDMFMAAIDELSRAGAKPQELAAVASFDPRKMVELAALLGARDQVGEALVVLDQADAMGASRPESLLARCDLQLKSGQVAAAQTTLAETHAAGIHDPRVSVLEAKLTLATKGQAGIDEALATLDLAATRHPLDVPVQAMRIKLVADYEKWQAVDRAIDGYKRALYASVGNSFDANIAAAQIRGRLLQWNLAIGEYRTALLQQPGNPYVWSAFGALAEKAGRDATARDAYSEAARLNPSDAHVTAALRRLEATQALRRGPALGDPGSLGGFKAGAGGSGVGSQDGMGSRK
jgi:tetratricopeptide (TPR) repeat protein